AKLITNISLARLKEQTAADKIRATNRKYLRLLHSTRTVPWELDLDSGEFTYMGSQAEEFFGYPLSYWKDMTAWSQTVHPEDREWAWAFCEEETKKGHDHDFTYRMLTKDGRCLWIHDVVTVIKKESVPIRLAGFMHDVTKNRQAEESRQEMQELLLAVLDNLPVGVAVNTVDPAVNFEYMNDNFLKYYRTSREALGRSETFWDAVYEDSEFREEIKARVLNDCASGDLARMYWEDVPITRKGEETTFISARNTPVWGKPLMISTVWDVTEHVNLEKQLRQSHKMEAIGTMAGGIAHDFNNLLAIISGNIDIIQYKHNDESSAEENIEHVRNAATRAKRLVKQILTFSRQEKHELV
ncbi:MAG: PAS domain S-box protein, partial [Desulfuromonadales bacterium]|nr:PAS domain S-box protein [Desulfuromonadales bacterium]